VVFAPAPITGFVLGVTVVGGFNYLVARERDGHFARYPYYGPYRGYYYRPEYRAYVGQYHDVPVHYGEWQNHAPGGAPPQPDNGRSDYGASSQRPNYDYNRGPAQYQPQHPSSNYNPGNDYGRGQQPYRPPQHPSSNYSPRNGDNRGQQYPEPRRPSSNYNPGSSNNRGQPYQPPQRPSHSYDPGGGYNRGGGYGGGRNQNDRGRCNSRGDSCSNH
jgi:hypothetical protein